MKAWKTMVKRIKEVSAHLVEEIMQARIYLVGSQVMGLL
jgi:hypothetical protein